MDLHLHLGLTPAASRRVSPMPKELLGLVPAPEDNNITVKPSVPDVEGDTMPLIINKAKRTAWQTKKLAAKLKESTLADTLRSDAGLILKYIKYKKDDPDHEQIRSPRRLLYEGCGDCDCFVVTLASLLINQGIDFKFRIAKYNSSDEWSHIYVIVPKKSGISVSDRANYYVLDPVTNRYDYEVPFSDKKDYTMSLQFLDGVPARGSLRGAYVGVGTGTCTKDPDGKIFQGLVRRYVDTSEVEQNGLVPTKKFLKQNNIPFQAYIDQKTNSGYFLVNTPAGPANVPTIITKDDAQALLLSMSAPGTITTLTTTGQDAPTSPVSNQNPAPGNNASPPSKGIGWLQLSIIGLGIYSLLKPSSLSGVRPLAGLPKRVSHPQKQKLKVVHI